MAKTKFKTVHHIVYSVKGGCGKTSFSLFLTLSNPVFDYGNGSDGKKDHSLMINVKKEDGTLKSVANYMIDLDFLGSSLMYAFQFENDDSLVTIPKMIFDGQNIRDIDRKFGRKDNEMSNIISDGEDGEKYILFSSPYESEKEKFHVKRENTPLLKYDEFSYEIRNIQKEIRLYARMRAKENGIEQLNLIYDMPPNSDGYTDAFLKEISEIMHAQSADESRDGDDQRVVLYLLYNNALMLRCNIDWLKSFLNGRDDLCVDVVFVYCLNDSIWTDAKKAPEIEEEATDENDAAKSADGDDWTGENLKSRARETTLVGAVTHVGADNAQSPLVKNRDGEPVGSPETEDNSEEGPADSVDQSDVGTTQLTDARDGQTPPADAEPDGDPAFNGTKAVGGDSLDSRASKKKYLGAEHIGQMLTDEGIELANGYYFEFPYSDSIRILNNGNKDGEKIGIDRKFLKGILGEMIYSKSFGKL